MTLGVTHANKWEQLIDVDVRTSGVEDSCWVKKRFFDYFYLYHFDNHVLDAKSYSNYLN